MPVHLYRAVEHLKKNLLSLSAHVEENFRRAIESFQSIDQGLARTVIVSDIVIDEMEVDVEEECLKILALHQPVAFDLRYLIAVLKINNDLERIGDLSVNIAEEAISRSCLPPANAPFDLTIMAEKAVSMVRKSLDSLINLDPTLSRQICASDDEVDAIHGVMLTKVREYIHQDPEHLEQIICFMKVAHSLERIADHATNIAEDIIYLIEGNIVRHKVASS